MSHIADRVILTFYLTPSGHASQSSSPFLALLSASAVLAGLIEPSTSACAMTFKTKLIAGIVVALATLAYIGVLSYRSILRSRNDVQWVTHTHEVLEHLDGLLIAAVDAETAQRGFIITGDDSYLEPYRDTDEAIERVFQELRQLTSDNPIQQRNLDRLEPLLAARSSELRDRISLRRKEGLAAGVRSVEDGTGKWTMDQVRAVLGDMTAEEHRLREVRVKEADVSAKRSQSVIVAGNTIGFLFLFFAGLLIYQEMARRRGAEEKIRELNADLEDRVARRTAELNERTQDLARSNAELQQFAYVASHDLQEPLRMVASFTQLLARRYNDKLGDDAREFIHYAVDGATRLQTLISDLLSYSRVGTHSKPLEFKRCDEVLDRVLLNLKLAVRDAGAIITRDPLPPVMADEVQLGQLFQNLLTNAMKFRGENSPRIHISAVQQGALWKISVRDNGIGIAPEHADRIWVIFQRLHTKTEYAGTGIGLAICKKIAERHGGTIWVEPSPGGGSTFSFTIPVCKNQPQLEERTENELRVSVAHS